MPGTSRNPLRDLELRIEQEGEDNKRRRLAEELQKLADLVPAFSPSARPPCGGCAARP